MPSRCSLYGSLGLGADCTPEELTRSFRKLALKFHPDKNPGEEDKFREVARAYKILSDLEARKIYDVAGEDALRRESGEGGLDPFSNVHYSWADVEGLFKENVVRRRGQDIREDLEVTLADLYTGATKNVTVMKYVVCPNCKDNIRDCYDCNGSAIVGGNPCRSCTGHGIVDENDPKVNCDDCKGERVLPKMTSYKITVRPGMYGGQYIPFVSEGNEEPGSDPGDRVFILKAREDSNFERINMQDLATELVITSQQKHQPGGFVAKIKTLDGRNLDVPLNQGIRNGTLVEIPGEGFPDYFIPSKKGKLIVKVSKVKHALETNSPNNVPDAKTKKPSSLRRYIFLRKLDSSNKNETPAANLTPRTENRKEPSRMKRTSSFRKYFFPNKSSSSAENLSSPSNLRQRIESPKGTKKVQRSNSFGPFGDLQMRFRGDSRNRDAQKRATLPARSPGFDGRPHPEPETPAAKYVQLPAPEPATTYQQSTASKPDSPATSYQKSAATEPDSPADSCQKSSATEPEFPAASCQQSPASRGSFVSYVPPISPTSPAPGNIPNGKSPVAPEGFAIKTPPTTMVPSSPPPDPPLEFLSSLPTPSEHTETISVEIQTTTEDSSSDSSSVSSSSSESSETPSTPTTVAPPITPLATTTNFSEQTQEDYTATTPWVEINLPASKDVSTTALESQYSQQGYPNLPELPLEFELSPTVNSESMSNPDETDVTSLDDFSTIRVEDSSLNIKRAAEKEKSKSKLGFQSLKAEKRSAAIVNEETNGDNNANSGTPRKPEPRRSLKHSFRGLKGNKDRPIPAGNDTVDEDKKKRSGSSKKRQSQGVLTSFFFKK